MVQPDVYADFQSQRIIGATMKIKKVKKVKKVKKLADMSPQELAAHRPDGRTRQAIRREKIRLGKIIPSAYHFEMPEEQVKALREYVESISETIKAEGSVLDPYDEFILRNLCRVLHGFDKEWIQKVTDPDGVLIGGCFPDAVASEVIQHFHREGQLTKSETFLELYKKFIHRVGQYYRHAPATDDYIRNIKAEIAGTYRLPEPKPEKKPEPKPEIKIEIQKGPQATSPQAQGVLWNVPLDASRYLNGGTR